MIVLLNSFSLTNSDYCYVLRVIYDARIMCDIKDIECDFIHHHSELIKHCLVIEVNSILL